MPGAAKAPPVNGHCQFIEASPSASRITVLKPFDCIFVFFIRTGAALLHQTSANVVQHKFQKISSFEISQHQIQCWQQYGLIFFIPDL
jgi:hypothetical protein